MYDAEQTHASTEKAKASTKQHPIGSSLVSARSTLNRQNHRNIGKNQDEVDAILRSLYKALPECRCIQRRDDTDECEEDSYRPFGF